VSRDGLIQQAIAILREDRRRSDRLIQGPNPYDIAFRERAVRAYNAGEGGYHELRRVFGIAWRTLQRWVAQYRETGELAPQPKGGGWSCPIDVVALKRVVREAPDGAVGELCWEYNRRVPVAHRTNETSFRRAMRGLRP
jgi:transposase-like protein